MEELTGTDPTGSGLTGSGLPMIGLDRLDNDLAGWLDRVLIRPGALAPSAFEQAFVAIVQASAPDPLDAWTAFYRNTIDRLARGGGEPGGTIAEFAPVHERAVSLVAGHDVLELGCCFGFLSLRLAQLGHRVTALDLVPGTMRLLSAVAARLGVAVSAVAGDVTAVPLADGCADTVLAVHLLEHLPVEAGAVALAEMVRLARRRVIVAVPFEDEPNPTWGHLRCFDTRALDELGASVGAATGLDHRVHEHHGGWLVLDRQPSTTAPSTTAPSTTAPSTSTARNESWTSRAPRGEASIQVTGFR